MFPHLKLCSSSFFWWFWFVVFYFLNFQSNYFACHVRNCHLQTCSDASSVWGTIGMKIWLSLGFRGAGGTSEGHGAL